ncbi:MAG: hypothetical protein KF764_28275 [Labilithrix sp.]|nr:hypothetical protein [Labilithrix sp.]
MSLRFASVLVTAAMAAACGLGITGSASDEEAPSGAGTAPADASLNPDAGAAPRDAADEPVDEPDVDALTLATTTPASTLDLDVEGPAGWAHWGLNANPNAYNQRSGFAGAIPTFQLTVATGAGNVRTMTDGRTTIRWTEGTPTATSSGTVNGVYSKDNGPTFTLRVPLTPKTRELVIYAGLHRAKAMFVATLGDGADAITRTETFDVPPGNADYRFALAHHVTKDTDLTIRWSLLEKYDMGNSNVTLIAATLR